MATPVSPTTAAAVDKESTEIRCQEQTKGGLKYEVILAEPTVQPPPVAPSPATVAEKLKAEEKLKAAEERRSSLEQKKGESWSLKMSKIEEVTKKRNEMSAAFMESTRKALDAKMHLSEEKRDAHINEIKTKLKEHLETVEKARVAVDEQTEEISNALQEKLNTASSHRDENIKKMQERLKEHKEQVARVKQNTTVKVQQLELQIQEKLDQARERRELIEREQKAKLLQHDKRIQIVRQNKAARDSQGHNEDDDENKANNETASSG